MNYNKEYKKIDKIRKRNRKAVLYAIYKSNARFKCQKKYHHYCSYASSNPYP
jgi:hypothetical protein